jgi:hypothetical protein
MVYTTYIVQYQFFTFQTIYLEEFIQIYLILNLFFLEEFWHIGY